jgi:hypothetical protein
VRGDDKESEDGDDVQQQQQQDHGVPGGTVPHTLVTASKCSRAVEEEQQ